MSGIPDIAGFLSGAKRPLLVLVGPTASGKTALSLSIVEELRAQGHTIEIINGDSRQLYRLLDIGTAKIRPEEMRGIPHHLMDVLEPKEEVTAAWYKKEAERVIAALHAKGVVPFLVGGSMLYVSAIIDNLEFVSQADPLLREKLRQQLSAKGPAALYEQLQELDPEGALSVDSRNAVYLLRALEICLTTGMRLQDAKKKRSSPYNLFIMGLDLKHEELQQRIAQRVREMFAVGWVEEVQSLLKKGYTVNDPGMQSHGYREIAALLRDHSVEEVKVDRELQERIAASSRQYAKRQMTWWRHDARIHWISPQATNRS
ncbi:MAG: tRNA (adenosine(37)-N6)-dimethylallyltransferase MiaA [Candidatus Peribacteraceae bacterium]|nr:tRNA (adenosine(37)-N6)-dimethylallyltransferase MiaA [Candidatus Peribacteraceae bacterium]MDD5740216.1 tRNA (adenosine(37)-N6)-dimethylallyltransferase MiaA [Candidatus Peribacteraceae bacterium]